MPVIACPNCGTKLNAPDSVLGKEVVCGQCRQRFTAVAQPAGGLGTPAAPPAPSAPAPAKPEEGGLDSMEFVSAAPGDRAPDAGEAAPQSPAEPPPGLPTAPPDGASAPPPPPPPSAPSPYGQPYAQQPISPPYGQTYSQTLPPAGGATASLVLGIASIPTCCCWPLGLILSILALVFSGQAIRSIESGQADPASRGTASGGRTCGIIGLCLGLLMLVFWIISLLTDGTQYHYNYNFP